MWARWGRRLMTLLTHELPPERAKMMRDIVFRTHLDVFRRALLGDSPARMEPMTVRLQPSAMAMWAKPRASPIVHIPGDEKCWGGLLSRGVTRRGRSVCVLASVNYTEVLFARSDKFPTKEVVRGVQGAAAEGGSTSIRRWGCLRWIPKGHTGWSTMATALSGCRPGPTL